MHLHLKKIVTAGLLASLTFGVALADNTRTPRQQESVELFRKAISFRSVKGHKKALPLATMLADSFRAGGFSEDDVHLLAMKDDKAALVVRFRGDNSSGAKPILFMAHMDVVDALRSDWQRDPFEMIEEDGYFYGRGTMDNKAGVVNLTSTFLRLRAEGYIPNRDLIIAFSGDEESDGATIHQLVTKHHALVDAEYALNSDGNGGTMDEKGKALNFTIQTSEKSYMTFELVVTNPGGHSSLPRADNAIYELAGALKKLEALRFPVRSNDTTRQYFRETAKLYDGAAAKAMADFAADPGNKAASDYLWTMPTMVGITRTTCIATMLKAGHAENALPQKATATVNCRVFPGETVANVQDRIEGAIANDQVTVKVLSETTPTPPSPLRDDIFQAVKTVVQKYHPGTPIIPYMAPYFTDGKFTRDAGIPTYGVGGLFIGPEDERAHGLDERVPVKAFFQAQDYWYDLMKILSSK